MEWQQILRGPSKSAAIGGNPLCRYFNAKYYVLIVFSYLKRHFMNRYLDKTKHVVSKALFYFSMYLMFIF